MKYFLSSIVQGLVINDCEEICLGEILSCCNWFCALRDRQNFALSNKYFRIWFYRIWYSWKAFDVEFGVYTEKLIQGNLVRKRKIWFVNSGWDHTQYCCYGTDFATTASAFSSFIWGLNFSTLPWPAANYFILCRRWQPTLFTLPSLADNSPFYSLKTGV